MKVAVTVLAIAGLLASPLRSEIKGCTSDVRAGVCNKICSTKHVSGCTLEQLDPLLKIQSMDCLKAVADKEFSRIDKGLPDDGSAKRGRDACSATLGREIDEWKKAQTKKK